MNIQVTAAAERGSTPLSLDRKLFNSVFGVVTWHALHKVVEHCQKTPLPLKPCTGSFTRAMGLPCAHVCDTKRNLGGLVIDDFDEHWFWDRSSVRRPIREPKQVRSKSQQNLATARTGRILSSFETVSPIRAPPMCSACHQRGHTRTSRYCPVRIQADIALGHQALRDNELQQASQALDRSPTRLRATTASPTSSTGSFHTAVSFTDVLRMTPVRPSANISESTFNDPKTISEACPRTSISPQRTFRKPLSMQSGGIYIPDSLDLQDSNFNLPLVSTPSPRLSSPSPSPSPPPSPVVARPTVFPRNCPEMVYSRYLEEKGSWLAQHPHVLPAEYRKARGFQILSTKVLRDQVHTMPLPQINEGWRIHRQVRWLDEEIYAWIDYEQALEDRLYEEGLARTRAAGRLLTGDELRSIQEETDP